MQWRKVVGGKSNRCHQLATGWGSPLKMDHSESCTCWIASMLPKLLKLVWRFSAMPRGVELDTTTSTGRTWKETADGSARAESSSLLGHRHIQCENCMRESSSNPVAFLGGCRYGMQLCTLLHEGSRAFRSV